MSENEFHVDLELDSDKMLEIIEPIDLRLPYIILGLFVGWLIYKVVMILI